MASSGNFCTFNPLSTTRTDITYEVGNTSMKTATATEANVAGTHGMTSGKFYWEAYPTGGSAQNVYPIGIYDFANGDFMGKLNSTYAGQSGRGPMFVIYSGSTYLQKIKSNGTFTNTDVSGGSGLYQIALDLDNNKVWFGKDNTWADSGDPANGSNPAFTGGDLDGDTGRTWMPFSGTFRTSTHAHYRQNWGQDSTFGGLISAGGNADGNGFGDFKYAPPTGFLSLASSNLPISDDIDPAQTDDDYAGGKQFSTVLYSGTGSAQSIDAGLQADFVWAKNRGSQSHRLADSTRGSAVLFSDTTDAQDTTAGISFDSDGFNWTNTDGSNANDSGANYVAWCWRANGGTTSTNSDGSTDSTVQANTKAGFSIVQTPNYSGTPTFGHGLSKPLDFIIVKLITSAAQWIVYHSGLSSAAKILYLNQTAAEATNAAFNSTAPTNQVFSLGGGFAGSGTAIAYCWHSVEGYSKFGSYEGNANNDGAFIYTGFRPRFVFIKNIDASQHWVTHDSARETHNVMDTPIDWDASYAEYTSSNRAIDFLSNGFKCRTSDGEINSAQTFVYGAWGDVPFKYNNTF